MEKFNWFDGLEDGKPNTYCCRRPHAGFAGRAGRRFAWASATCRWLHMVDLWSEPPFATIGLGTGTMASYGRPYQHVHYYEIDNHVRRMSLPLSKKDYYFSYANLPAGDSLYLR